MKKGAFYNQGAMGVDAVKKAYFDMFERFNYPVPDILQSDNFWVCDFLQGNILSLGMGGIFWINQKGDYRTTGSGSYKGDYADRQYGYLLHEIYLLPGQTLPEHNHLGGPEDFPPKMESWQVRYGEVCFYGEYQHADEQPIGDFPKKSRPFGYGED